MSASLIEHTPSAYDYPLLIKHLLHTPLATAPDQEIVYRDISRYTYRTLRQRIGRLAAGLAALGVKPGDTVAVMDWDSHRYLECYFAIPMMGAVLQTVNIRLSPAVPPCQRGWRKWPWTGGSMCSAAMACRRRVRSCRWPNSNLT